MVVIAPGLQRLVAVARHGVGRQCDQGNICRIRVGLQGAGGGPAVHHRQVHVQQDDIRPFQTGLVHGLLAVMRQNDVIAPALETARQEIQTSSWSSTSNILTIGSLGLLHDAVRAAGPRGRDHAEFGNQFLLGTLFVGMDDIADLSL